MFRPNNNVIKFRILDLIFKYNFLSKKAKDPQTDYLPENYEDENGNVNLLLKDAKTEDKIIKKENIQSGRVILLKSI